MVSEKDNFENRRGMKGDIDRDHEPDANRDPISGTPGAHPVGVGLGAAGAGAAGAAIGGAIGGPVGAAVGAVAGGIAGGLGGKAAAEAVNPTVEDEYWHDNYVGRPYVSRHDPYETYQPAYRFGWESYARSRNEYLSFDEAEPVLERDWDRARGSCPLNWEQARPAARDAWERLERSQSNAERQSH